MVHRQMKNAYRTSHSNVHGKPNAFFHLLIIIALLLSSLVAPASQTAAQTNTTPFHLNWSSVRTDSTLNISWGDYDGDGDLDLAVANGGTQDDGSPQDRHDILYRNDHGTLDPAPAWESAESAASYSVAWGDYDSDGDLDLAVGNKGQNRLYRNDNGSLTSSAVWTSSESDFTRSVAWGDYDGDGDLDLAAGNIGQPNRLYRNDSGVLTASAVWSSATAHSTWSVAWGDYDGDGDLDLVAGNGGFISGPSDANNESNELYKNNNGTLTTTSVWQPQYSDATTSVAWGDYDGDGDLDLVVGNFNETSLLYQNDHGALATIPTWFSQAANTTSVAWVDYDGDGDLDLALGNESQPIQIYRNEGGRPSIFPTLTISGNDRTYSVAWGDYDNDGDLDLATGNFTQSIHIYSNTIGPLSTLSQSYGLTAGVAWGDYDNDGDLDLVVGNGGANNGNPVEQPERLYRNDNGTLTARPIWESGISDATTSVAWGDYDNDGFLDLLVANTTHPSRIYHNNKGQLDKYPIWESSKLYLALSGRWGDYDNDGDLDFVLGGIALAGISFSSVVYRNEGLSADGITPIFTFAVYTQTGDSTASVDWMDYDGDKDLDLVVGNLGLGTTFQGQPNRIYRYDGRDSKGNDIFTIIDISQDNDVTWSVAWSDYDKDGYPDLAVGNQGPDKIYHNNGPKSGYTFSLVWTSTTNDLTRSVAWVDYDGDGDLDLSTGNQDAPNRIYRNDNKIFTTNPAWEADTSYSTTSLAWGDYDRDGRPDLAAGNIGDFNQLYHNEGGGTLTSGFSWTSRVGYDNYSTAWGDYDGDGDLDLAVGKGSFKNGVSNNLPDELYRNDNGVLSPDPVWKAQNADLTTSLAWGDYDNDGDLDLVTGNGGYSNAANNQPEQLYRNDNGVLTTMPVWSSTIADSTYSVAWGDYDGDGDLDLMVGNTGMQPSRLYRNDQGQLTSQPVWETAPNNTTHVAWGDYDGDGDLDLVLGNFKNPSELYRNDGLATDGLSPTFTPIWSSALAESTWSVAWGDYDGDGDLDLAVGNEGPNRVYRNDGGILTATPVWSSAEASVTYDVAWNDYDNDGDLDLIAGNGGQFVLQPTRLYRNDNGMLTTEAAWQTTETGLTTRLAWGDYDNDGDADLVTANIRQPFRLYRNNRAGQSQEAAPSVKLSPPGNVPSADLYSTSQVLDDQIIPISYTLSHPTSRSVRKVIGLYSLNGGGQWLPAISTNLTETLNLSTSPSGTTHLYHWDLFQSKLFGQSDNVMFRLVAVPAPVSGRNHISPPNMYGANAATTTAFRVRGTQVRVLDHNKPAADALVYRLPNKQTRDAQVIGSSIDLPYHTNTLGYLQGRGQIGIGDQLVALLPKIVTDTYTLYYTSADPTASGLNAYSVKASGVQTLTVSSDNPLMLLKLDVSLEWDARYDKQYLAQLETNLKRTSELLYDWTDGQAALGEIVIYQNHEKWNDANIRIYATNRLRPNANQGGIVGAEVADPTHPAITYESGQVRIGAVWNRFGDPAGGLAEDWPRTLAHELGHYAFFLDDDYLGLDSKGRLVSVEKCPSAMSDPYRDDYSEFHLATKWLPECQDTLSNQNTGRSDWATIATFYPWLHQPDELPKPDPLAPTSLPATTGPLPAQVGRRIFLPEVVNNIANPGPSSLPLAVTQIRFAPMTTTTTLDVPIFYLTYNGGQVQPGNGARAFLFRQEGDRLVDLGNPTQDRVLARGSRVGDRLCVYDTDALRLGCETIAQGNEQLALVDKPTWHPDIQVTPVTSRTITIDVTRVEAGLPIKAQIFPVDSSAPAPMTLAASANGYTGTFSLADPALDGYIHVWVDEPGQRRELITDYTIGGNPGKKRGLNSPRGNPGKKRGLNAPVTSSDGEVILFGKNLSFGEGEFFALQATTSVPDVPAWTTMVGHAYRLTSTNKAPSLSAGDTSINFGYLGTDVPSGEEDGIQVYFYDHNAAACQPRAAPCWRSLATNRDTYHNEASAQTQGPGIYALMTSAEIPLTGPGWNLVSYPVRATRLVTEALSSIDGFYTTVYHYDRSSNDNPWRVYDVAAPGWVNDLTDMEFGQGYWINATTDVPLLLKGGSSTQQSQHSVAGAIPVPPATFYGAIQSSSGFKPKVGMAVVARIGTKACGQGVAQEINGQIVYVVKVLADSGGTTTGCGIPGRTVTFQVAGHSIAPAAEWDNTRVRELGLR